MRRYANQEPLHFTHPLQLGWTALHCACYGGHVGIVGVLLTHCVDLNTQDEVCTCTLYITCIYLLLVSFRLYDNT